MVKRLSLKPISYNIDVDKKAELFTSTYYSQYDPTYIPAVKKRAASLGGKERIYKWSPDLFEKATPDPSCKYDWCALKK